jgi:hypothetical protein
VISQALGVNWVDQFTVEVEQDARATKVAFVKQDGLVDEWGGKTYVAV